MPPVDVVRTYLEMSSPSQLRPGAPLPAGCTLRQEHPGAAAYRALYAAVGDAHHWRDRLAWDDGALAAWLARPDVSVWVLRRGEEALGYFELVRGGGAAGTEIAYFGLVPGAIGQGLGGTLLTEATRAAWAGGAPRVWLHTCTLDHPAALPNYLARGFTVARTERYVAELPAT